MAMVNSVNSKPRKSLPKQMLKDYLLDDLSSCSSNGFRSLPRRQCCVSTVRFLIDESSRKQKILKTPKPKSLLKRAITAAVKLLSSAAARPPENPQAKGPASFLSRWKTLKYFAVSNSVNNVVRNEECNGVSDRWREVNCGSYLEVTCGESSGTCDKDDVVVEVSGSEGVIVACSASSTPASSSQNKWQSYEVKEQFSPVSVMDFPSTDEEEVSSSPDEVSSNFQSRLDCVEGRKNRLIQKLQRFEGLAKVEPMNLSKKFTSSEQTNESDSSQSFSSVHDNITNFEQELEEEKQGKVVHKALNLLDQMNPTFEKIKFDSENILFEFFIEGVGETNKENIENELILVARDWLNGNPCEMYSGWEEEKNRIPYMRNMEKGGNWNIRNNRVLDEQKEEVVLEFEVEVLALLVNELVLDLI